MDLMYMLVLLALLLAFCAQGLIHSAYKKYSRERARSGVTGEALARRLLSEENIFDDIEVERIPGELTDHYNPETKSLGLSEDAASSDSIAALAVTAHEVGHVLQHRDGQMLMLLRTGLVPAVNFSSRLSWPLFLGGLIFSFEPLLTVGIVLYAVAVVFSLLTLPIEFDASRRGLRMLENGAILDRDELRGAKSVLNRAAMTYVASALMAVTQLLRMLSMSGRRRR